MFIVPTFCDDHDVVAIVDDGVVVLYCTDCDVSFHDVVEG